MAIIYKITSPSGKTYIGNTKTSLSMRRAVHKYTYNRKILTTTASLLFDESGFDACSWEILEECLEEVRFVRERYWIEHTECVNTMICGKTDTELKEHELQQKKEYYKKNCEIIKAKAMARYYRKKAKQQPETETTL